MNYTKLNWNECIREMHVARDCAAGKPIMNNTRLYAFDKEDRLLTATTKMPPMSYRAKLIEWTTNLKHPKDEKGRTDGEGKPLEVAYFALEHHSSKILTIYEDGSYGYPEGWNSATTFMRLNRFGKYRVFNRDWEPYISTPMHEEKPFQWGCLISPDGMYIPPDDPERTLESPEILIPDMHEIEPGQICLGKVTGIWWRHWVMNPETRKVTVVKKSACPCENH